VAGQYDPTIGIMHASGSGESAFIFDIMEPDRPKVDGALIHFLKSNTFHPADLILRSDGVCRLNPQLARKITALTVGECS